MRRRVREATVRCVSTPGAYHLADQPLLLDTHVWLWWLVGESTQFADGSKPLLARAEAEGDLMVSDISFWEVAVKAAKGKLSLPMDVSVWLAEAEQKPGIRYVSLTREILTHSTRLSGSLHSDPADRMLIATAQRLGVPLVTADKAIIEYAMRHSGLHVIDVRRRRSRG